jgi:hypothetical protein
MWDENPAPSRGRAAEPEGSSFIGPAVSHPLQLGLKPNRVSVVANLPAGLKNGDL